MCGESVARARRQLFRMNKENAICSTGVPPVEKHGYNPFADVKLSQGAYLPHWTQEGAVYAVTFRLHDSLPTSVLKSWRDEREDIVKTAKMLGRELTDEEHLRLQELHSERVDKWLDAGHGKCWLREDRIATVVEAALKCFDGQRYALYSWCIMPNHVHVVVRPFSGNMMSNILHSWKSFTSKKANCLLGRSGDFWQPEYYDHLIRDENDFNRQVRYVVENPAVAGLHSWRWVGSFCSTGVPPVGNHGRDAHATEEEEGHGRDAHATGKLCLALILALTACWPMGARCNECVSPADCRYDVCGVKKISANGLLSSGSRWIKPVLSNVTALAVGPSDRIVVGSKAGIEVLDVLGQSLLSFTVSGPVRALAVSANGDIFSGLDNHIEVFGPDGTRKAIWKSPSAKTMITSVAVSSNFVFIADCQNRIVWRFTLAGEVSGRIGDKDPARRPEGFVVPSAFFDIATAPDGSLWVVNPGMHRLEHFTADGQFLSSWGKASVDDDGFCGCCNPSNMALAPDGSFVTSEKHIVRVKRYDATGRFAGVISGSREWGKDVVGLDLAVDSKGRILVLDPSGDGVRVY